MFTFIVETEGFQGVWYTHCGNRRIPSCMIHSLWKQKDSKVYDTLIVVTEGFQGV